MDLSQVFIGRLVNIHSGRNVGLAIITDVEYNAFKEPCIIVKTVTDFPESRIELKLTLDKVNTL